MLPLLLLAGSLAACSVQAGDTPAPAQISVEASASERIEPTHFALSATVENRARDPDSAMQAAAQRATSAARALGALSLGDDVVAVTGTQLRPLSHYDRDLQQQVQDGYAVSRSIEIRKAPIARLGAIMQILSAEKVDRISGPTPLLDDRDAVELRLLERAMQQARIRAAAMARGDGLRLGELLEAATGVHAQPMPRRAEFAVAKASPVADSYDEVGRIEVSVTVQARYAARQ